MDELLISFLGSISGILVRIQTFNGSHISSNWFSIPRSLSFPSLMKTRSEFSSSPLCNCVVDTLQGGLRPNVIPTYSYFSFSQNTNGLVRLVGLQRRSLPRNYALCSHAVLQRLVAQHRNSSSPRCFGQFGNQANRILLSHSGDEPLVILDTLEDWRFAKNVRPKAFLDRPCPLRFRRHYIGVC